MAYSEIDIIVPCVRPEELNLQHLANLKVPDNVSVKFYVVIDRPDFDVSKIIAPENISVHIFQNHENMGASEARNTGLEMGHGNLVLFLDDDVVPNEDILLEYVNAVEDNPESPGFVGLTEFPKPRNRFTAGVRSSDILTFFTIANTRETVSWGTTSNLMLRRSSIGKVRFDRTYPKSGGGEDIDFCLTVLSDSGAKFVTVPSAVVRHDWWHDGKRHYRRFFRWAFGDGQLPSRFPELRYRNFPNYPEFLSTGLLSLTVLAFFGLVNIYSFAYFIALSLMMDIFTEIGRVKRLRPRTKVRDAIEGGVVRLSNELGRLWGNIVRGRALSITERFDYFTTKESITFERRVAGVKFILFVISFFFAVYAL